MKQHADSIKPIFQCLQHLTFRAHERGFNGFAPVAASLVEGQTLLSRARHHLCVVCQQSAPGK